MNDLKRFSITELMELRRTDKIAYEIAKKRWYEHLDKEFMNDCKELRRIFYKKNKVRNRGKMGIYIPLSRLKMRSLTKKPRNRTMELYRNNHIG